MQCNYRTLLQVGRHLGILPGRVGEEALHAAHVHLARFVALTRSWWARPNRPCRTAN